MSTIYQINPEEKCLVLEPKEALVYPFNFGSWEEIRIGAYMSLTTPDSFTGFYTGTNGESVFGYTGILYDQLDNFFWGVVNSGSPFPFKSGSYFAGSALNSGSFAEYRITSTQNFSYLDVLDEFTINLKTNSLSVISGGKPLNYKTYTGERASMYFPDGESSTGSNNLAMFNGLKFVYNSGAKNIYIYSFGDIESNNPSTGDLSNLETKINLFQNSSSSPLSGYCDESLLPSAMFLFSPFTGYRIRVHSFLIKKYL